jgi:hypothetical protein
VPSTTYVHHIGASVKNARERTNIVRTQLIHANSVRVLDGFLVCSLF